MEKNCKSLNLRLNLISIYKIKFYNKNDQRLRSYCFRTIHN